MADFNAMDWAQLYDARSKQPSGMEDTAAQYFATADAQKQGYGFVGSMREGLKNKAAVLDPLFELKKSKLQLGIMESASKIQQQLLSGQIRQKQIEDEASDNLSAANIVKQYGGDLDKQLEALNTTFWKTPRGIQNATQWRLQIAGVKAKNAASIAISKLTPQQLAVVQQYEQGSPQWWDAIEKVAPQKQYAPGSIEQDVEYLNRMKASGNTENYNLALQAFNAKHPSQETKDQSILSREVADRVKSLESEKNKLETYRTHSKAALDAARAKDPKDSSIKSLEASVMAYQKAVDSKAREIEALKANKTPVAAATAPAVPATPDSGPSAEDIKYLQANPGKWELFDKRFGSGKANEYLP